MQHLFFRMFGFGFWFRPHPFGFLRQWRGAARDFTPAVNERFSRRAPGEPYAQLNAEHQCAMAISVVTDPKLRAGRLVEMAVGFSTTDLARNSGFRKFLAHMGDLAVVG